MNQETTFYRNRWHWIVLTLIVVIYLGAGAALPKHIFWSADEGAKYLQLETLSSDPVAPAYPGHRLDPTYRFYPDHPIYPQRTEAGSVRYHWPIWFPWLSAGPFRWWGLAGLYLIPLVSGLVSVALCGWLAHRLNPSSAALAMAVVALASPMFIYSLLFWEHTLAVMLALLALAGTVCLGRPPVSGQWPMLAFIALLLAAAVALRTEMMLYALTLVIGLGLTFFIHRGPVLRVRKNIVSFGVELLFGLSVVLFFLLYTGVFNNLAAAGIIGPRLADMVDTALFYITAADFWLTFPAGLRAIWINSPASGGPEIGSGWAWTGLAGVGLAAVSLISPRRWRLWLLIGGAGLLSTVSAAILFDPTRYRTIHSLFLVAPYLLFMAAFVEMARRERRFEMTLLVSSTLLYLLLGTLAVMLRHAGTLANVEWGTRYLLLMYPLGSVCAVVGGWHLYRVTRPRWQKIVILGAAVGLIGLSGGYNWRGFHEIRETKADLLPYAQALDVIDQPLVTDLIWLPAVLSTHFASQEIYVLPERNELYTWLETTEGQVDSFVFAGFFVLTDDFLAESPVPARINQSQLVKEITFTEVKIMNRTPSATESP